MIDRPLLFIGIVLWLGCTLLLGEVRWFRRVGLVDRLSPYSPSGRASPRRTALTMASFTDVMAPLARSVGTWASRVVGIDEDLATRLERIHSPLDPTTFRLRQLGWSLGTFVASTVLVAVATPPPALTALVLLGAPALAFLVPEQQLAAASARWQRRLFLELPVVAEQLGMLLSSGYSLGAALNRLAERGRGACGQDLRRVCARIRYGATEIAALREWGTLARVGGVERLVAVLALNREAGDLGRLISEEARAIRRDAQRELIETIERRAQLVWVPVTVSALLPGTLFLVVPFVEAMRLFTRS